MTARRSSGTTRASSSRRRPNALDRLVNVVRFWEGRRDDLGFSGILPEGKGIGVLAYGPPGCGKTLAARVLARRLDRPVHLVGCPSLFGK